ncbi:MAG TPA: GAF domain-containing protein, partial [Candidatus Eisenbacteria bacterium]|nr:GAF domain-containing protein [Candidatus Eisenbacteria bacterium]
MNEPSPATAAPRARSETERLRFIVRASRDLALLRRDAMARKARDLFLEASAFREFSLWVLDPRTEVLYPWTLGNTPVLGRRPRLQVGQGLAGQAVAEEQARYHASLPASLYEAEEWGGRALETLGGVLTLPLRRGGEPLGVAVLHMPQAEPTEEEIAFLVEFSAQLAIAAGNARIYSEAMREKVENQLLLELGTKISGSLDSNQLLEQILDLVFQVVRYDAAGIYLVDKR